MHIGRTILFSFSLSLLISSFCFFPIVKNSYSSVLNLIPDNNLIQQDTLNKNNKKKLRKKRRAEKETKVAETNIHYEDYEYNSNIKSVCLFRDGFELSAPIIEFRSPKKLRLLFDDLEAGVKNYKYYYIHCDADWQPSIISDYEFQLGFSDDFITDYSHSINTRQMYTHYELLFPTDNISLVTSGNYLLVVFDNDDRDDIVLTRRFWIYENNVSLSTQIKRATIVEDMNFKQEITFSVNVNSYQIPDPFTNLKVIITQNGRYDNALFNVKPEVVNGSLMNFDINNDVVFNGGNEFRNFDIKTIRSNTIRVKTIRIDSVTQKNYITLLNDQRRTVKQYLNDKDINGRFLIKSDDNITNNHTESEYVYVHFTLPYNVPFNDGDIYILGALTDWRFTKDAIMKYNYELKAYEATLYLKQGYYNYEYVFLPKDAAVGDETVVEGTHFETENEYTIFIYNREVGLTFDKLIGLKQINTTFNQ